MVVRVFGNAFLVAADNYATVLPFQVFPETIRERKAANYANIPIPGRGEPIKVYHHSTPRTISFSLGFFASVDQGDAPLPSSSSENADLLDRAMDSSSNLWGALKAIREFTDYKTATAIVERNVQLLKSFVYPEVQDTPGGATRTPPVVLLIIGETVVARCVVVDVDVQWMGPWHVTHAFVHQSFRAEVNLTLDEVSYPTPLSSAEARQPALATLFRVAPDIF